MIVEKVLEAKERKIKGHPVNSNRASDLGHPCVRYHVLNRTKWTEKALHDVGLQMIFDMGNLIEDAVIRDLQDAGIRVIEQQRSFSWPEYQITGHIDGLILLDERAYPMEIKSCSPFMFRAINSIDDLKKGKYGYMRKYPSQLNLYLLMDNKEKGLFIFKDKSSGAMKEIWMDIDMELGEEALRRAEAINKHLADNTMPDPIPFDDMWCGNCPFTHLCLPAVEGKEVEIDTGNLAEMLTRLGELKPIVSEYEEIDEQVKKVVEGREKILAGSYFVTGKWIKTTRFDVPKEVKAPYARESKYWKRNVQRVGT